MKNKLALPAANGIFMGFVCFLALACLFVLTKCQTPGSSAFSRHLLDDLSVNTDDADKTILKKGFQDYNGQVIKVSPKEGPRWGDYSRPINVNLNKYSGPRMVRIHMSVWVEKPDTPSAPRRGGIDYPGNPNIGWTMQNGDQFVQFGSAVEVETGKWIDFDFVQSIDISGTGTRNIFMDGLNEHQGLVDLILYFRNFKVTVERVGKYFALTFDDGPTDLTEALLDKLYQLNVKATFFLVGMRIDARDPILDENLNDSARQIKRAQRQALVRRMVHDGHEVANHSYSHNYLGGGNLRGDAIDRYQEIADIPFVPGYSVRNYPLSENDIRKEIEDTQIAIQKAIFGDNDYANRPIMSKFFRTPFTSDERYTVNLTNVLIRLGMPNIYGPGTDDYVVSKSAEEIAENFYNTAGPWVPSINHVPRADLKILDVLDIAVPRLKAEGYEFITISEMEMRRGIALTPGAVYYKLDELY